MHSEKKQGAEEQKNPTENNESMKNQAMMSSMESMKLSEYNICIYVYCFLSISPTKKKKNNASHVTGALVGWRFGPARSGRHPFGGDIDRPNPFFEACVMDHVEIGVKEYQKRKLTF